MFRSQVQISAAGLDRIAGQIEQLARRATEQAARTAAETAQGAASIDLELEVIAAHADPDGVAAGIRSRKKGRASAVEIAHFFDAGTLGGRTKPPKRPGRDSWQVKRGGGSYTAKRRSRAGGIKAERFFAKARQAGRKAMLGVVQRGI